MLIDYSILGEAQKFYISKGYDVVEVPWIVSHEVNNIAAPQGHQRYLLDSQSSEELVASGEQGFLQLIMQGHLIPGKYQTVTPCFRDDEVDYLHQQQFMKLELIHYDLYDFAEYHGESSGCLSKMIEDAEEFFNSVGLAVNRHRITLAPLLPQIDLEYKGQELGSYGIRKYKGISWIYGTGVAEPRFSRIKRNA